MRTITLRDTRTKQKQDLVPVEDDRVLIYSCGPTLYQQAHIGNMRAYVFADTLNRAIRHFGRYPDHVINFTDVGHLTDDLDAGEDKVEQQARREQERAETVTRRYADLFLDDLRKLRVNPRRYRFPRATEHIAEQIRLIEILERKGYTYSIADGVYFDTRAYPEYGAFGLPSPDEGDERARVQPVPGKKRFQDFALWKLTPAGVSRQQEWDSPWGRGFPGWHIECSAMAMHLLGETIDIHTGGTDHISVHHTNEIAQSEGATGKPFARIWMHSAFLNADGEKISKSLGNAPTIADLERDGYDPLALRYLFLQSSYHTPLSFSLESLAAAQTALSRMRREYFSLPGGLRSVFRRGVSAVHRDRIDSAIAEDLNTAQVLATVWDVLGDTSLSPFLKRNTVRRADRLLGLLGGSGGRQDSVPEEVSQLIRERDAARAAKEYTKADTLRESIRALGYEVLDRDDGGSDVVKQGPSN